MSTVEACGRSIRLCNCHTWLVSRGRDWHQKFALKKDKLPTQKEVEPMPRPPRPAPNGPKTQNLPFPWREVDKGNGNAWKRCCPRKITSLKPARYPCRAQKRRRFGETKTRNRVQRVPIQKITFLVFFHTIWNGRQENGNPLQRQKKNNDRNRRRLICRVPISAGLKTLSRPELGSLPRQTRGRRQNEASV